MKLEELITELRNNASLKIDQLSTLAMVKVINDEDQKAALAVERVLPAIATASWYRLGD